MDWWRCLRNFGMVQCWPNLKTVKSCAMRLHGTFTTAKTSGNTGNTTKKMTRVLLICCNLMSSSPTLIQRLLVLQFCCRYQNLRLQALCALVLFPFEGSSSAPSPPWSSSSLCTMRWATSSITCSTRTNQWASVAEPTLASMRPSATFCLCPCLRPNICRPSGSWSQWPTTTVKTLRLKASENLSIQDEQFIGNIIHTHTQY